MSQAGALRSTSIEDDQTHLLHFRGLMLEPLASGALYWRAERMLLVADLHLEKFSSYARTGQMLPPYDTASTLRRLAADLAATGAQTLVSLGDGFHRDHGTTSLPPRDRALLGELTASVRWIWISGNHDPSPHDMGGECVSELRWQGLTLTHEPSGIEGLIAGHLHPAARVVINGRSVRRPCFVHDDRLLLLPAYGSSTGSINILGPAFAGLFDPARLSVTMLGRERLYPVSPRRLIGG